MLLVLDMNFSVKTSKFWSIFRCIHVQIDLMLLQLLYFPIRRRQFSVYFRPCKRSCDRVCAFGRSWRRGRQFLGQHLFPTRTLRQSWCFWKNNAKKQNKDQTVPPRTWHHENSTSFFCFWQRDKTVWFEICKDLSFTLGFWWFLKGDILRNVRSLPTCLLE